MTASLPEGRDSEVVCSCGRVIQRFTAVGHKNTTVELPHPACGYPSKSNDPVDRATTCTDGKEHEWRRTSVSTLQGTVVEGKHVDGCTKCGALHISV